MWLFGDSLFLTHPGTYLAMNINVLYIALKQGPKSGKIKHSPITTLAVFISFLNLVQYLKPAIQIRAIYIPYRSSLPHIMCTQQLVRGNTPVLRSIRACNTTTDSWHASPSLSSIPTYRNRFMCALCVTSDRKGVY